MAKRVKILMHQSSLGQDVSDGGSFMNQKMYVKGQEYTVHEDLANAFLSMKTQKGEPYASIAEGKPAKAAEVAEAVEEGGKKSKKGAPENKGW